MHRPTDRLVGGWSATSAGPTDRLGGRSAVLGSATLPGAFTFTAKSSFDHVSAAAHEAHFASINKLVYDATSGLYTITRARHPPDCSSRIGPKGSEQLPREGHAEAGGVER